MVLLIHSNRVSRAPPYFSLAEIIPYDYRTFTFFGPPSQVVLLQYNFVTLMLVRLLGVRSSLLAKSFLLSFPAGT